MKIAIVTHRFVQGDGQGRVNYEVARSAAEAFDDVILIAADVAPELQAHPHIRWERASHGPLPTALLRELWFSVSSARAVRRARKEGALVMVNGAITLEASDVNAVHFVHGGWIRSPYYEMRRGLAGIYQRFYGRLNAALERRAFRRTRRVVAVSELVAGELQTIGVPAGHIEVIPNGVDIRQFCPGTVERAALGLPEDGVLALFVGDITTERKNLATVLAALVKVPDLHLVVVGDASKSRFPQEAERLGIAGRVSFLGFRRDIPDLMRAADIFVFPSRYEACSLVLLEAMASGLTIVTADTAGGAELIDDRSGPNPVEPDDVTTLAGHLARLPGDAAERTALGHSAREAATRLTWETMGDRYLSLFRELAAS